MGNSIAVELPALDWAALVRIQVPQPGNPLILQNFTGLARPQKSAAELAAFLAGCYGSAGERRFRCRKCVGFPRLSLFGFVALSFALLISWRVPATLKGTPSSAGLIVVLKCTVEAEGCSLCPPIERDPSGATEPVSSQGRRMVPTQDSVGDVWCEP